VNPAVWVARHGRLRPAAPALADGERVHADWATFAARTASVAAGLRKEFGVSPGDRVAILMRNRPEYLEALFGIWHAGLVAVPINARLHRDEIAYILQDSGTAVVVTPTWAKLIDFETTLPSAVEELIRQRDERQRA
jgi:long-chain acyl-CoA synthetase